MVVTKSNFEPIKTDGPLKKLARVAHEVARNKGWWIRERTFGEITSLFHSEVSEAFEEHRKGLKTLEVRAGEKIYFDPDGTDWAELETLAEHGVEPEGVGVELADVIIRILDFAEKAGLDMDSLVSLKTTYNRNRPYRHGDKVL